jgi:hypothetical protein
MFSFFSIECFLIYNFCVESFYKENIYMTDFFSDMSEDNNRNDEESSGDENLNEDVDFYDFLEAVADKIDTITSDSID